METLSLFKHLHLPNTFTFQTLLLFNHFYFPTTFTSKTLSLFKHLHFPNTFSFQTLLLLNYFYFPTTFISQTLSLSKYFHFHNQAYLQKWHIIHGACDYDLRKKEERKSLKLWQAWFHIPAPPLPAGSTLMATAEETASRLMSPTLQCRTFQRNMDCTLWDIYYSVANIFVELDKKNCTVAFE